MLTEKQFVSIHELLRKVGRFQVEKQAEVARDEGKEESDQVQSKGVEGPFTYVDKQSEKMLEKGLRAVVDCDFRGEESTEWSPWKGLCWIVDPLDGTVSYLWRKWHWSISVALFDGEDPVACFVYNPLKDILYSLQNGKALRNNEEMRANKNNRLICGSRNAKPFLYDEYVWDGNGSGALACAMVASGEMGAYACATGSEGMRVWDVAAGIPILLAAGGAVEPVNKEKDVVAFNKATPSFPDFVAGTQPLLGELLGRLRK